MRFRSLRFLPWFLLFTVSTLLSLQAVRAFGPPPQEKILIDTHAATTPLPHFWEKMFGSGRAILSLRENYRNDLREMKKVTEFKYVRFHGILHDEVGIYNEDESGNSVYNFTYLDQIYDGLLANGVRPFVEIGFMPRKLASRLDEHPFWYKPIVSPPKDYGRWDRLIQNFAQHLIDRYGIEEVSQWYFEVWNEPNIDFWTGEPKQATYFELYEHTARALKSVNTSLRVGGPSTAAADWADDFLAYVAKSKVPVDFVSSHAYGDDTVENLFHSHEDIPMDHRVCRAIKKVKDQIKASAFPDLPLLWTEWSVPSFGDAYIARDTHYVAAGLAENIRQCDGLVEMMSYWTFSDVFEESGVRTTPFNGGFGVMASGGIKKPAYHGFALLHKLGDERFANLFPNVLVTRRNTDNTLVIAAWNLTDMDKAGTPRTFHFHFAHLAHNSEVQISRVDEIHGNTLAAYRAMGSPKYPTMAQIAALNRKAELPPPVKTKLINSELDLDIPVNGLAILELPLNH